MNILHIISGLAIGGAETMLVQLASRLQQRGLRQHVVTLRYGVRARELEQSGIAVTSAEFTSVLGIVPRCLEIVALVRRLRPHIIQGWMYHGDIVATLAHILSPGRSQRRLFWGIRASNMDDRYRRLVRCSALLSRWPDVVTANSAAGARFHLDKGYRPRRIEIIPNGIDVDRFRADPAAREKIRAELGISSEACVAIHVARVDPMKDHAACIAALRDLTAVTGLFVGKDTETLPLPANALGLGPRTDVAALYAASDIVLSTSAFGEGFSNAIAEGMSAGLVPIATDVGDSRSIVGETGTVVSPGDVAVLTAAIRQVSESTPQQRRMRGQAARDRIAELYSLDRATDHFIRLYTQTWRQTGHPQR